jgi:hypothetical protein
MTVSTKPYQVSEGWQGGRILITFEQSGYGITQVFHHNEGPQQRGGEFGLGWQKYRSDALKEGRTHAEARKARLFIEEAVQ